MSASPTGHPARAAALAAAAAYEVEPTSRIDYRSQGRLLIVGPAAAALDAYALLADTPLTAGLLVDDGGASLRADDPRRDDPSLPMLYSRNRTIRLSGHLGAFRVTLDADPDAGDPALTGPIDIASTLDPAASTFDLVLDLATPPLLDPQVYQMLPFGYLAVPAGVSGEGDGDHRQALRAALEQLAGLTGEFEKPKYFVYDPAVCAHGRAGLPGCRRCLDACPAGAITSLVERIEVDPYRCQGGGSCAAACPSGAIVYAYPQPADSANRLRAMLRAFRDAGGGPASLLFHDGEAGAAALAAVGGPDGDLAASLLPIEVEEIGSVGMELWLSALAYGAQRVLLLVTDRTPASVDRELREQLETAHALLTALDYPAAGALALCRLDALRPQDGAATLRAALAAPAMPAIAPAGFAGSNDKRAQLFAALDRLWQQSPAARPPQTALPTGALFGEIAVDREACTLCMGCVSVCPAGALGAGGDTPRLDFIEANCLQCGLCRRACPEDAITLHPRYLFERETRRQRRVLNEEPPFLCIRCGTPFATRSVIDTMQKKLSGHAMFRDPAALERIKMCGDCRVRAMFEQERDR